MSRLARGFTTLVGAHGESKYIFVDGVRMWATPRFLRFALGLGTYWLPVKDVYSFVLDVGYGGLKNSNVNSAVLYEGHENTEREV